MPHSPPPPLAPPRSTPAREADLAALAGRRWDLLVVGGGASGAAVARDAALRGLAVALVERHDLAFGASSRSSRLIHGGLRYLAHGDLALVREGLVERGRLLDDGAGAGAAGPFPLPGLCGRPRPALARWAWGSTSTTSWRQGTRWGATGGSRRWRRRPWRRACGARGCAAPPLRGRRVP